MANRGRRDEEEPLLREDRYFTVTRCSFRNYEDEDSELLEFSKEDPENPRAWSRWKKLINIIIISSMSVLSPLSSSIFAPGISTISKALNTTESAVIACQTGFVVMLGFGPLILAPLSETFGRKRLYLLCFGIFALLQIPTALARDIRSLILIRTITGFFGSVCIANGGGTISDMYESSERAVVLGWYLLGPLLGPSIGPLIGGIILTHLDWPWLFWVLLILSSINLVVAFFFLQETYGPTLLSDRKRRLQKKYSGKKYHYKAENGRPLGQKLFLAIKRPMKILFLQPIVLTMALYQALIFATTYTLNTQIPKLYGPDGIPSKTPGYDFSTFQTGLVFLSSGLGFLVAIFLLVPKIDTVYNRLTNNNDGTPKPEFRLPIANIGSVLIPISLFAFAWLIQFHIHWSVTLIPLFLYGIGQVSVFNSTQNYYIDAFETYAASAIAAGAFFRSLVGGIIPLLAPGLFDSLGAGWGISMFGFVSLVVAPSPLLFFYFGERLRERFAVDLE